MGDLAFVVRTPRGVVFDARVDAVRAPTDTGQVGVRPRAEPAVLVVTSGLVVVRRGERASYVATSGGLLRVARDRAVLLSAVAVAGDDGPALLAELDRLARAPSAEMELRRHIERLERSLLVESRRARVAARPGEIGR